MADAYSSIPLHSSAPLNPTPYGYDGPPLASRILYGDSSAVTKLMDGIFLGGIEAGQDLEFCSAHKITHIVNCSGSSDILSQYGLKYLSLRWLDGAHGSGPGSVMFDPQGRNIQRIFKFIEGGRAKGEGILIHSMDGNSRAIGVMMAYLMRKFRWGMTKCFPSADHRILTNRGFLFLEQAREIVDAGGEPLLYASYSPATRAISYVAGELVLPAGVPPRLVDITQGATRPLWETAAAVGDDDAVLDSAKDRSSSGSSGANHISLRVTPDHDMYVSRGDRTRKTSSSEYGKVPAGELAPGYVCQCVDPGSRECPHGRSTLQLLCAAENGVDRPCLPFVAELLSSLSLRSTRALDAFLELYGCWMADGSLLHPARVVAFRAAPQTEAHLRSLLAATGLREGEVWTVAGAAQLHIHHAGWFSFFDGLKQEAAQCWAPWVLSLLSARQVRLVLEGLRLADGSSCIETGRTGEIPREEENATHRVFTSSASFRDQIVQACLHAGYSAHTGSSTKRDGEQRWFVSYARDTEHEVDTADVRFDGGAVEAGTASPSAAAAAQPSVASPPYDPKVDGPLWCVKLSAPSDGLIIAQRALRGSNGAVARASRPVIIGNCLEYIRLKRPHIHPSPTLLKQLARAAQYLNLNPNDQNTTFAQRWETTTSAQTAAAVQHSATTSPGGTSASAPPASLIALEQLLHNTFLNGHAIPVHAPGTEAQAMALAARTAAAAAAAAATASAQQKAKKKLVWIDEAPPPSTAAAAAPAVAPSPLGPQSLKRTPLRRSLNPNASDDAAAAADAEAETEEKERDASARLVSRALGVHYNSSMAFGGGGGGAQAAVPTYSQVAQGLIRPGGCAYGLRPTPPEISQRPLLKTQHLLQWQHHAWSINLNHAAQQQQQQHHHQAHQAPQHQQQHASGPPIRPSSASQRHAPPPASPSGPRPGTSSGAPPPSSSMTAAAAAAAASSAAAAAAAASSAAAAAASSSAPASANSRSAWTPEASRASAAASSAANNNAGNGGSSGGMHEYSNLTSSSGGGGGSIQPSASPQPSPQSSPLPSSAPSSSAVPFARPVPGKPIASNYRPSSAPGVAPSASASAAPSASTAQILRGSSSVDEITDAAAAASLNAGGRAGSAHGRHSSLTPSSSTAPGPLTRPLTAGSNASNASTHPGQLTPTSSSAALALAQQQSPYSSYSSAAPPPLSTTGSVPSPSASPAPSPTTGGASFSNGLAGRPLRNSFSAASGGGGSALTSSATPVSAASANLAAASAAAAAAAAASPYSFMSSPSLSSTGPGSATASMQRPSSSGGSSSINGYVSNGGSMHQHQHQHQHAPQTAPQRPASGSTIPVSAGGGPPPGSQFSQTAPLKLNASSAGGMLVRAPMTASPQSTMGGSSAPRLAVLMSQNGPGGSGINGAQSASSAANGAYAAGYNQSMGGPPSTGEDSGSVRSSAQSFAASRSNRVSSGVAASAAAAANSSSGGGGGGNVTVPAFLSASYAHLSSTSYNPSSSSSVGGGSAQPIVQSSFYRGGSGSASSLSGSAPSSAAAFASSGIAHHPPHAHAHAHAAQNSGVIQWWVQDPSKGAGGGSSAGGSGGSAANQASSDSHHASSSGAYPSSVSSQAMLMFNKARAGGGGGGAAPGAGGSTIGGGLGGAKPPSSMPGSSPSSSSALMGLMSASPAGAGSVGGGVGAKKAPASSSSGGKVGSSSAAGFYSSGSSPWIAPTQGPGSSPSISPYAFLSSTTSIGGGGGGIGGGGGFAAQAGLGLAGAPMNSNFLSTSSFGSSASSGAAAAGSAGSGSGSGARKVSSAKKGGRDAAAAAAANANAAAAMSLSMTAPMSSSGGLSSAGSASSSSGVGGLGGVGASGAGSAASGKKKRLSARPSSGSPAGHSHPAHAHAALTAAYSPATAYASQQGRIKTSQQASSDSIYGRFQ